MGPTDSILSKNKKIIIQTYQTYINNQNQETFVIIINHKLRVFIPCLLSKILFFKKCWP